MCAFPMANPRVWNDLPQELHLFPRLCAVTFLSSEERPTLEHCRFYDLLLSVCFVLFSRPCSDQGSGYISRSFENLPFCPHWSRERFRIVTLKGRNINF